MSDFLDRDARRTLATLPAVLREPVERWFAQLAQHHPGSLSITGTDPNMTTLMRLVASSEFASNVLLREWPWFVETIDSGGFEGRADGPPLDEFRASLDSTDTDLDAMKRRLRRFRNRQHVHILWRTLSGDDAVPDTLESLSRIADVLVASAIGIAGDLLAERFGRVFDQDGNPLDLVAIAMGKLGGHELNFSSDIDLIFLYSREGETDGPRQLSAHEYFTRVTRLVIALLDEVTADGFVYRVDTRLRPFGESGPPVSSFAALEAYLVQHGRGWERYAWIKARVIHPAPGSAPAEELQNEIVQPFVYRRYIDYGVFESLRDMHDRIAAEVKRRELAGNIKLGPGGIREIEFIAQSMQLVRGGADAKLQTRSLVTALEELAQHKGLRRATVDELLAAYTFLRRLENAIQALRDRQTHDVPDDPLDRARLLIALDIEDWPTFESELARHRQTVSRIFSTVAFRSDSPDDAADDDLSVSSLRAELSGVDEWRSWLEAEGYNDSEAIAASVAGFLAAARAAQIDRTAERRVDRFLGAFLQHVRDRPAPASVCKRVLAIVSGILRRSAYVALLNENPAVLERLIGLCDQSAYLAKEIARFPVLLDELLDPRLYTEKITFDDMRADLEERLRRLVDADTEQQIEMLAQYQRAWLFRIAVADIGGSLPIMKVSDRLTELGELVLQKALALAWQDLASRHGEPAYRAKDGSRKKAGFGVIGYGKLGGIELSYRSDLDLVFLHDSGGGAGETNGAKPIDNTVFFSRLVRRLVHFLTTQTGAGVLYEVDTRLRPSGKSGLLVVSVDGFERYQEDNAWTWEHQALLRSRAVAGSPGIAREFDRIRADTLRNRVRRDTLLDDVLDMRGKMRAQLDKSNDATFDLKQGEGGMGDIEFLVQYLVLKNAATHPAVIHYSDNIRQLGTLEASGCLAAADVLRLQETYRHYRLCTHRLALDGMPALVPSDQFLDDRQFVVAVWQREMA